MLARTSASLTAGGPMCLISILETTGDVCATAAESENKKQINQIKRNGNFVI
jgi:hypothetical protein